MRIATFPFLLTSLTFIQAPRVWGQDGRARRMKGQGLKGEGQLFSEYISLSPSSRPTSRLVVEDYGKNTGMGSKKGTPYPSSDACATSSSCCAAYNNGCAANTTTAKTRGIPGLEYLGLGYNIAEGNPRGSSGSELDPGFRSRVIKLVQNKNNLTVDQSFLVPIGTEIKYSTSCKFSSSSVEVSSESDLQRELSKESSTSASASRGGSIPIEGFLLDFSIEVAYSHSEKFQEFKESRAKEQSMTFEAKALCTEFEANFQPYANLTHEDHFDAALQSLPAFFDPSNEEHKGKYKRFIDAFGTHYVNDVVLGAKHIYSSVMKARDFMELTRKSIDVKSSLSVSVQASLSAGGGTNAPASSGDAANQSQQGAQNVINTYACCKDSASPNSTSPTTMPGSSAASNSGSITFEQTDQTTKTQRDLNEIQSRIMTVNEVNVGGVPPEDNNWKTWAASVRDRPMPVVYKLTGIWELMPNADLKDAFFSAFKSIYGLDLDSNNVDDTYLRALHFGVSDPSGTPISTYNLSPASKFRVLLQINDIPRESASDEDMVEIHPGDRGDWLPEVSTDTSGYFGCGAAIDIDDGADTGWSSVMGLRLTFCNSLGNWSTDQQADNIFETTRQPDLRGVTKMCPKNHFIVGANMKYDSSGFLLGMTGLSIFCKDPTDEKTKEQEIVLGQSNIGNWQNPQFSKGKNGFVTGATVRAFSDSQGLPFTRVDGFRGIQGLKLRFNTVAEQTISAATRIFTYTLVWQASQSTVSAVFATMIRDNVSPNVREDANELGFISNHDGDILGVFQAESFVLFGNGTDPTEAKISVADFTKDLTKKDLQSFAFLAADNLPRELKYIAGVVHPQGYPMNDIFGTDTGYEISQGDSDREFIVSFTKEFDVSPTFIVFPHWFPGFDSEYPTDVGQLAVAPRSCTTTVCTLVVGTVESEVRSEKLLGFSFLALDGGLSNATGVIHGVVNKDEVESANNNFSAKPVFNKMEIFSFKMGNATAQLTNQIAGGVLITFGKPFKGIPSVVASVLIGDKPADMQRLGVNNLKMPSVIIEHVTKKSVFIKAGMIDTTTGFDSSKDMVFSSIYTPLSFSFVAVGPP